MASRAIEPAVDAVLVAGDGLADRLLRGGSIGPGGGRRDISFAFQPLAELVVGAADVLVQRVSTGGFVL